MPKTIDRDLLDCLRRANPYVEYRVEISAPDVGKVLRRPAQWTGAELVPGSMTPADSLSAGMRGLQLTPTPSEFAAFRGELASYDLNREDPQRRLKGVSWKVDDAFNRAVLWSVTVRIKRSLPWWAEGMDFELQIYRVTLVPGRYATTGITGIKHVFTPLLNPGAVIKATNISWSGSPQKADLTFGLRNYSLAVDNGPPDAPVPAATTEKPYYYFVVRPVNPPETNGIWSWMVDTVTARDLGAGHGIFRRTYWNRDSDQEDWAEQNFDDCPYFVLNMESYLPYGTAIYRIDLGRAPAAGTVGRVVLDRTLPRGTAATIEISTAGASGPWVPILNEEQIPVAQQVYWIRVTLTADASGRATPAVYALGAEYRTVLDVSVESILELPSREIQLPWGTAAIPEATLSVLHV